MKEVTDEMFDDILKSAGPQYFFHRLEDGEIILVFKSGVRRIEPGEEDSAGRIWSPKVVDANGNPLLDRNGKPREPWAKYEAEVEIKGIPYIYSFSGERSSLLRNFAAALKKEDIKNSDLPGTKWSIERVGEYDWKIVYLGREWKEESKPSKDESSDLINQITEALREKKDQSNNGLSKQDLIVYLAFVTHKKSEEIEKVYDQLLKLGIIKEESGKVYIS